MVSFVPKTYDEALLSHVCAPGRSKGPDDVVSAVKVAFVGGGGRLEF
jgi:hypothetical protein